MVTRRDLLKAMAVGASGIVAGLGITTLAARALNPSGSSGVWIARDTYFDDDFDRGQGRWLSPTHNLGNVLFSTAPFPSEVQMDPGTLIARASVPPTPCTVTAHCSFLQYTDIDQFFAANMLSVGSATKIGTTGSRHYAIQWDIAFLGEIGVIDGVWDAYNDQVHQNHYIKLGDGVAFDVPNYLRLVVASGTDISAYYSFDGVNWQTYITHFNPNVSVEAVFLHSYHCTTRWDWIRFS